MTAPPPDPAATRLLERAGEPPRLVLRRGRLTVTRGPDRGRELAVERTSLRIGSDPDNDLVLTDETVSARHVEIALDRHGCLVRDLGSTNGTFVDGLRVVAVYLRNGAEIAIGETSLKYALRKEEVELPLSTSTSFGALLGHSVPMRAAFAVLERVAPTDVTVLVLGESGTGKELAARALHDRSPRREGPYVIVDCGAVARTLIESQLFGHARGAFTGAAAARSGAFEEADGGTVVIDEIGELPLDLQPKLLRAVEGRTVQRLGETAPRSVDVRIVAMTNRNLQEEVRAGRFREDLFFRLSVIVVRLPPLRERREEIPRLVRHFLGQLGKDPSMKLPPAVLDALMSHTWPGNVRELRNAVERLLVLSDIDPTAGLAPPSRSPTELPFHEAKQAVVDRFEREYIAQLLAVHGGKIAEAARAAGVSRQWCYRLLQKHGLEGV